MVTITKRAVGTVNSGHLELPYNSSVFPSPPASVVNHPPGSAKVIMDGMDNSITLPKNGAYGGRRELFFNFTGITIPQGSTINSATLTTYIRNNQVKPFKLGLKAVSKTGGLTSIWGTTNVANITIPYNGTPNVRNLLMNDSLGPGSPWNKGRTDFVKKTATPTADVTLTDTISTTGTADQWPNGKVWDVKTLVQTLVNNFDYNNNDMFFQLAGRRGGGVAYEYLAQNVYTDGNYTNTGIAPAVKGTPTSQGTGPLTPKLLIDFTAVQLPPRQRSCRLVDAILVASSPPPDTGFEVADAILAYLGTNGDKTGFELIDEVINPVTSQPYNTGAIKNSIGFLNGDNLITGAPYVPLQSETGAYNFKKTTWTIV